LTPRSMTTYEYKNDAITSPTLRDLHWLPVRQRIDFKMGVQVPAWHGSTLHPPTVPDGDVRADNVQRQRLRSSSTARCCSRARRPAMVIVTSLWLVQLRGTVSAELRRPVPAVTVQVPVRCGGNCTFHCSFHCFLWSSYR